MKLTGSIHLIQLLPSGLRRFSNHTSGKRNNGQLLVNFLQIRSVALTPDGRITASGGDDSFVHYWDISTGECFRICKGHAQTVLSVAFSPDGKTLATCSEDTTVRLRDTLSGQCFKTLQAHTHRISSVAFSPDSKTLASCSEDYTLRLWDAKTGQCLKTVYGQNTPVY